MVLTIVVALVDIGNDVFNDIDDCRFNAVLIAVAFRFPARSVCGN